MLRSSFLNVRRARGSFGVHRRKGLGWLFRSLVMLFATRNGPEERASCLRQLARLTLVSWRVVSPEITVTRNLSTASRTQCACDTPGLRSCCPTSAAGRIWSCEAGLGVRPRGRGAAQLHLPGGGARVRLGSGPSRLMPRRERGGGCFIPRGAGAEACGAMSRGTGRRGRGEAPGAVATPETRPARPPARSLSTLVFRFL